MSRTINGFRTAQYTPERALRDAGLAGRADVGDLVTAAAAFDDTNPGYLSATELRQGAEALAQQDGFSADDRVSGYRFSGNAMGAVQDSVLKPNVATNNKFTALEILSSAATYDDGNKYLNKKELKAGAFELQLKAQGLTVGHSLRNTIRRMTGLDAVAAPPPPPPTHNITFADHSDGIDRAGLATILATHFSGITIADLEAEADEVIDNREGTRVGNFSFSAQPADGGYLEVNLFAEFDYEGSEFSHYTTFKLDPTDSGISIVDAGAD